MKQKYFKLQESFEKEKKNMNILNTINIKNEFRDKLFDKSLNYLNKYDNIKKIELHLSGNIFKLNILIN